MISFSRRRFLQSGAIAGASSLLSVAPGRILAALAGAPIGIQLYTVGKELQSDVRGTLRQIAAIGYTEVETAGFAGLTAREFRDELTRAGLHCHSAHMQWNVQDLGPIFDDAHALGVNFVVSSALLSPGTGEGPSVDDYKKLAAKLNGIAQKTHDACLQYAYHNHNFEFKDLGAGIIGYDILLSETDPVLVQFELDCGWMIAAGFQPIEYFKKYPRRYRMLHIKDFVAGSKIGTSLAPGLRPQGTELGRGHIDYKPILHAAAGTAVKYLYVEQEPPFLDMPALDAAKVDYDYLRRL
jgi:sugar phosphate isomerase/epimerase